ncbi:possible Zn-dependent hydrolase [Cytophaga hutchinsonii ATCC 33406]|jgi:L-ascorbate metabolism protein UlaG (beta-lactamase superfamily)|uniref:Possible Zn-dependent hydrolase n=2 Tax=Cytophaga hutchinsonii TaxID=985 RepID=A0A6N4SSX6_CYTH3|nr:possible Zn-dependent hydrolase [Cytophaga hutchinsonii ATCC 33406]
MNTMTAKHSEPVGFTSNPDLATIPLPFEWKGTPLDAKGRFLNHEFTFINSLKALWKWQTMINPQKEEKKKDTWRLACKTDSDFLTSESDCIVWLGHASFFIRLAGITLLIDPVLFDVSLIKRKCAFPVDPNTLKNIDYILVSHDHRDHCDKKSLELLAKNNPTATYLTGLKVDAVIKKITGSTCIQAAGWYQQYNIVPEIKITYVPSRHWGRRYLTDTNVRLWGGYVIEAAGKTIYFGGDSGYGSHFADIGKIFPFIDYAMIGIGAYKPEFFMAQSHLSPIDGIKAFEDTKAKYLIPMHYGTFDLADEPLSDPIQVLKKAQQQKQLSGEILYLCVGEIRSLESSHHTK